MPSAGSDFSRPEPGNSSTADSDCSYTGEACDVVKPTRITNRIRELREAPSMSQGDLAGRIGVTRQTVVRAAGRPGGI